MLQAVLFDLDGTLLQVKTEDFMKVYLKEITAVAAAVVEPERFVQSLLASTNAMMQPSDQRQTNAEVFWADFCLRMGENTEDLKPLLEDFYVNQYNNLSRVTKPGDKARQAVQKSLELGLRIVLATNPVFPDSANRERMDWAGVGDLPWELVTSYEHMHNCKPNPKYYLEIASRLQLEPENCLMVGNDVQKDIVPAVDAGMSTFLVTDYLVGSVTDNIRANGAGNLSDFIIWLNETQNNN